MIEAQTENTQAVSHAVQVLAALLVVAAEKTTMDSSGLAKTTSLAKPDQKVALEGNQVQERATRRGIMGTTMIALHVEAVLILGSEVAVEDGSRMNFRVLGNYKGIKSRSILYWNVSSFS